jgi:hypothetical protein
MYLSELDPSKGEGRYMVRVLASVRDEVLAIHMASYGGRSRELAMVATKLDEARLWAIAHGEATGSHVVMDRREVLGDLPDGLGGTPTTTGL